MVELGLDCGWSRVIGTSARSTTRRAASGLCNQPANNAAFGWLVRQSKSATQAGADGCERLDGVSGAGDPGAAT